MTEKTRSTVERAFQLANDGTCRTIADLKHKLKSEGYAAIEEHLQGTAIRQQLAAAMRAAAEARKV